MVFDHQKNYKRQSTRTSMHLAGCGPPFEDSPHNRCLGVGSTNSDSSLTFNPWYTQTNRQSVNSTPKCRSIGILTDIYLAFFCGDIQQNQKTKMQNSPRNLPQQFYMFSMFSLNLLSPSRILMSIAQRQIKNYLCKFNLHR